MNVERLFDSIVNNALESKVKFNEGAEWEAFSRLEEIVKTIEVLKDFRNKVSGLNLNNNDVGTNVSNLGMFNKDVFVGEEMDLDKKKHKVMGINLSNDTEEITQSSVENNLSDQFFNILVNTAESGASRVYKRNAILPGMQQRLDTIFFDYLQKVCDDKLITTSKGDQIHQITRIKKKALNSDSFQTFKFRISPFCEGFKEEIRSNNISEEVIDFSKIKLYLWKQPYICRFNQDGRKAKTKGSHIWTIEAKNKQNQWHFKKYFRKIVGPLPKVAYIGLKYIWFPKIWDPQVQKPNAVFSSPWLPNWLRWENNCLTGTPGLDAESCEISAVAQYQQDQKTLTISVKFFLTIARLDGIDVPQVQNNHLDNTNFDQIINDLLLVDNHNSNIGLHNTFNF